MGQYFSFSGRATRFQYWMTALFTTAVWAAFMAFVFMTMPEGGFGSDEEVVAALMGRYLIPLIVLFVLTFWLTLSVAVRRYHDRDKSGLWYLVVLIPYIGAIWQLVECGFLRGTPGTNSYGPPVGANPEDYAAYDDAMREQAAKYGNVDAKIARMKEERQSGSSNAASAQKPAGGRPAGNRAGSAFGRRGQS
jgi:uncharacterized membrane protein YhaH (DUF805 family)